MAKVYLSSTLLDLKEERRVVSDWLISAGFQPVHSYFADTETVRDSCLEDIAECDLYILLLGHRYGYQPRQDNPDGLSITQLEFRHAGKLNLPRLAFLQTSIPDVAVTDIADPERAKRIYAFRAEVAETLRAAEFKDVAGLLAVFSAAIVQYVMKLLKKRDAQVGVGERQCTEPDLSKVREAAVSQVLAKAESAPADDHARQARAALLKGDTELAEQLLQQQEARSADQAGRNLAEAAALARQVAALAFGRDSRSARMALQRAAGYQPGDFWTWVELGDTQAILGESRDALASYLKAQEVASKRIDEAPGTGDERLDARRDLSASHNRIGNVLVAQGDGSAALASYRKGLSVMEELTERDPDRAIWQRDLSVSYEKVGSILAAQGDGPAALEAFRKCQAIREDLARLDPDDADRRRDLSVGYDRIGDMLFAQGDNPGALEAYRHGQSIVDDLSRIDPDNTEWQRDLSVGYNKIGDVLSAQGEYAESLAAHRQGLVIAEALCRRDPANTQWQRDLSISHNKVGDVLMEQGGDVEAALASYRQGLAIRKTLVQRDPANLEWQRDLAVSYNKIGFAMQKQGDAVGALDACRKALDLTEALTRRDPGNTLWQRDLSVSYNKVGDLLLLQEDSKGALEAYGKGLAIVEALSRHDPANAEWLRDRIISHFKLGEVGNDAAHLERALAIAADMNARGVLAPRDEGMIEALQGLIEEIRK